MRWKCTLAYDGTDFAGWQRQPNGTAVQELIESRLAEVFERRVVIHGAGRTDAGVHARQQVFHFDADWPHGAAKLLRAVGHQLPDAIQLLDAREVSDDFHARFSAIRKRYSYTWHLGQASPFLTRYATSIGHLQLHLEPMQEAAALLVGRHDFASFSANPKDDRSGDTTRTLFRLEVQQQAAVITLIAEADGFLFRMVRSLAGCLFDVGRGRLAPQEVAEIRRIAKRTNRVRTAPPQGLSLDEVFYPDDTLSLLNSAH